MLPPAIMLLTTSKLDAGVLVGEIFATKAYVAVRR
jgi:hypothetical protein